MKHKIKRIFKKLSDNDQQLFAIGCAYLNLIRFRYPNIKLLTEVDYKVFSQCGEDGIIDYLLTSIGINKPKFVEIGTENYKESNTRFLFQRTQCQGLIVDSDPKLSKKVNDWLETWRGELNIISNFITKSNIHSILSDSGFNHNLDLFSLDIDGIDYWIINELPEKFAKVAVVEFNPVFGPDLEITVPYNDCFNRTDYHFSNLCWGASLSAFINLFKRKRFTFVGTNLNCNNAFFVDDNYVSKLNLDLSVTAAKATFTNNFVSESRDINGKLSYIAGNKRLEAIKDLSVVDLSRSLSKEVKLSELV